jgi:hypothetical protein
MDIERLTARNKNGLAYLVNVKPNEQEVDSPHKNTLKCILDCFERLAQYEDEAIARHSVKSEDVAEAIEQMEDALSPRYLESDGEWTGYNEFSTSAIRTAITALQEYQPWVSVKDRLPEKPQYDWVLVRITLNPDGFVGLPHIAELRRGEWFSTEYDLPIEQMLQGTVTHWKPLPEPPKGEGK